MTQKFFRSLHCRSGPKAEASAQSECGRSEYWIVDPFEHNVEQLLFRDGVYEPLSTSDVLQMTIIDDLTVRLEEVW